MQSKYRTQYFRNSVQTVWLCFQHFLQIYKMYVDDVNVPFRAYRIGQCRDVTVLRLISLGTVEEIIYLRQVYKQVRAPILNKQWLFTLHRLKFTKIFLFLICHSKQVVFTESTSFLIFESPLYHFPATAVHRRGQGECTALL